jgi:hypothetical protein
MLKITHQLTTAMRLIGIGGGRVVVVDHTVLKRHGHGRRPALVEDGGFVYRHMVHKDDGARAANSRFLWFDYYWIGAVC